MLKNVAFVISALFLGSMVIVGYSSFNFTHRDHLENGPSSTVVINDPLPQVVKSPSLNKGFHFAGEAVPRSNFDAMERLDRELTVNSYFHSSTLTVLKRTKRHFPLIEKILAEQGIPDDIKFMAIAESALSNATSPSGAKGFWQIMKPTGEALGLEIATDVDERYHIEKATLAASLLMNSYYKRFGSWTLAAAAYNLGETRMAKEIKSQKETDYYRMNLGSETARYVFRIIALKEIIQSPNQFGFYNNAPDDLYKPLNKYYQVEVDHSIPSLAEFAHSYGVSYRMLKLYNPWLRTTQLRNNRKKKYLIKIPKK